MNEQKLRVLIFSEGQEADGYRDQLYKKLKSVDASKVSNIGVTYTNGSYTGETFDDIEINSMTVGEAPEETSDTTVVFVIIDARKDSKPILEFVKQHLQGKKFIINLIVELTRELTENAKENYKSLTDIPILYSIRQFRNSIPNASEFLNQFQLQIEWKPKPIFNSNTTRNSVLVAMLGVVGLILLGALGGALLPALSAGLISVFATVAIGGALTSLISGVSSGIDLFKETAEQDPKGYTEAKEEHGIGFLIINFFFYKLQEWITEHVVGTVVGVALFLATVAMIVLAVAFPGVLPFIGTAVGFVSSGLAGIGLVGMSAPVAAGVSASIIGVVAITAWDVLCRIGTFLLPGLKDFGGFLVEMLGYFKEVIFSSEHEEDQEDANYSEDVHGETPTSKVPTSILNSVYSYFFPSKKSNAAGIDENYFSDVQDSKSDNEDSTNSIDYNSG